MRTYTDPPSGAMKYDSFTHTWYPPVTYTAVVPNANAILFQQNLEQFRKYNERVQKEQEKRRRKEASPKSKEALISTTNRERAPDPEILNMFYTENNRSAIAPPVVYLLEVTDELLERIRSSDKSLTSLSFKDSPIGDAAVKRLADALKVNTMLTTLDLSHVNLHNDGLNTLVDALKINHTLTELDLDGNNFSYYATDIGPDSAYYSHEYINGVSGMQSCCWDMGSQLDGIYNLEQAIQKHNFSLTTLYTPGYSNWYYCGLDFSIKRNVELRQKLFTLIEQGNLEQLKKLIQQGVSVNGTPVRRLSRHREASKRHEFIPFNEPLNFHETPPFEDTTPVHKAIEHGHFNIVKFLVEQGANLTVKDKDGLTPLELASKLKNENIKNYLHDSMQLPAIKNNIYSSLSSPSFFYHTNKCDRQNVEGDACVNQCVLL